jgi:hypothetical protein
MDREQRDGLAGLPVNSGEVIAMDAVRAGGSDQVGLIVTWMLAFGFGLLAWWASSIILALTAVVAGAAAGAWTFSVVRDHRAAKRMCSR